MDQRYRIPPLAALNAFAAFARTGGIRRAAADLRVDHAAISRHMRDLEQILGTELRDRTTGGLTQAAQTYYAGILPHLDGLARATADIQHQTPSLTVTCVHGFAYHWLLPRLAAFRRAYPDMDLLLRPLDASTAFHATGIAAETHADICYVRDTPAPLPPRGILSLPIARPPVFPVISPQGLAALGGQPETWADLLRAPLLHEEDETEWRLWFQAQNVPVKTIPCAGRLWQAHITLAAARAGEGIALSNPFLLGDDLQTGRLIRIQPTDTPVRETPLGSYVLRTTERGHENRGLTLFRNWLLAQISDESLTG